MNKRLILVPSSLDLTSALQFSIVLASEQESDAFTFDFSKVGHVEPFGMLIVSGEIRRLSSRFPAALLSAQNYRHMSYAAHMGFFRAFGLDFGNAPGQAPGSLRYVPLTLLPCDGLARRAIEAAVDIGDAVEGESKHLAAMLCGEADGAVHATLSYSLREIMRNVVEHSDAADIELCAQYWPTKKKVEVAILDRGIGLRKSLSNNPHLDAADDKRAINYALMPAVSGKAFKGSRRQKRGHWVNSGFGLYMTNRICRNGGNFFVASGDSGMLLTKSEGKRYFDCNYDGTAIRMVIRTDQITNLDDALETYRKEGYEIQSRYKEIVNIDPSAASLMLSQDFDLSLWNRLLARVKGLR